MVDADYWASDRTVAAAAVTTFFVVVVPLNCLYYYYYCCNLKYDEMMMNLLELWVRIARLRRQRMRVARDEIGGDDEEEAVDDRRCRWK